MNWSFLDRLGMTQGWKLHLGNCVKLFPFFILSTKPYSFIVLPCDLVPFSPSPNHPSISKDSLHGHLFSKLKNQNLCNLPSENILRLWPADCPFLYSFQSSPFSGSWQTKMQGAFKIQEQYPMIQTQWSFLPCSELFLIVPEILFALVTTTNHTVSEDFKITLFSSPFLHLCLWHLPELLPPHSLHALSK